MDTSATFWLPTRGSTVAKDVDALFYFLTYLSTFFFVLIVAVMIIFVLKYRRKEGTARAEGGKAHNVWLEATWIVVPTIIVIIIFVWGAKVYLKMTVVPAEALEIKVTAQKWFWSFDYPEGGTTVNELVVPVDKPVKLLMSSRDVIHSLFIPAFRVKRDVLPNRYQITWFQATATGEYNLLSAEYCGSKHSSMTGIIRVLNNREYMAWLEELSFAGEGFTPLEYGEKLYTSKACNTCHSIDGSAGNGPSFFKVFNNEVKLDDGSTHSADENYIRESILIPTKRVVAGFQPIMPTYQGLLKDREIDALVAYIKSLGE